MKKFTLLTLACFLPLSILTLGAQTTPDLTGTWKGSVVLNNGEVDGLTVEFKKVDGKLAGIVNDEYGTCDNTPMQKLTIKNNTIRFMLEVNDGDEVMEVNLTGEIKGNAITGNWADEYNGTSGPWEIDKVIEKGVNLSGTWEGFAVLDTGDEDPLVITFVQTDEALTGKATDEIGMLAETPLEDLKLDGKKITFSMEVATGGGYIDVMLQGMIEGHTIKGEWVDSVNGSGGTWEVTFKKE